MDIAGSAVTAYLKARDITMDEFNYNDYADWVRTEYYDSARNKQLRRWKEDERLRKEHSYRAPYWCEGCRVQNARVRGTRYCRHCGKYDSRTTIVDSFQTIVAQINNLGEDRLNLILDKLGPTPPEEVM